MAETSVRRDGVPEIMKRYAWQVRRARIDVGIDVDIDAPPAECTCKQDTVTFERAPQPEGLVDERDPQRASSE
jgi:hypothetical protein